jgi:hypothetical protein
MLPLRQTRKSAVSTDLRVFPTFVSHSGTKVGSARPLPPTQPLFVPQLRSERKKAAGPQAGGFR